MEVEQTNNTPAAQNSETAPAGAPATPPADVTIPVAQQSASLITPQVSAASAQEQTAVPPAPSVDPRAEINQFAESLGIDPAGLADAPDMATARTRVRQWLDQQAQEGAAYYEQLQQQQYATDQYGAAPQYQPQYQPPVANPVEYQFPQTVPGTTAPPSVDLKALGLEADDPIAKVVLAMDARAQQQQRAIEKLVSHFDQQQQRQREQARVVRTQAAESAIDAWNSPLYGKAGRRTIAQQARVAEVYRVANYAIAKDHERGFSAPVEQYVNRARFQLEHEDALTAPQQQGAHALPSVQPAATQQVTGPSLSMNERWSENAAFMASLKR